MYFNFSNFCNQSKIKLLYFPALSLFFYIVYLFILKETKVPKYPLIVSTWAFNEATGKGWSVLKSNGSAIDAVVAGCSLCEEKQCDGTVGYGGSPDENGETSLDALIMDGSTMNIGAVANLKRIKQASKVARHVLENTKHTLLVGEGATQFAKQMGFNETDLSTDSSLDLWKDWKKNNCQPNFWSSVGPDPQKNCGPYKPIKYVHSMPSSSKFIDKTNHDTIGMVAVDFKGNIAAGTSTNGAKFKIPGRVGDSPIPGSGAYAVNFVGAAAATGDGDIMMRYLPSYFAVTALLYNYSPLKAALMTMENIAVNYPDFKGGIVVVDAKGRFGAACHGLDSFPYSVASPDYDDVKVFITKCIT